MPALANIAKLIKRRAEVKYPTGKRWGLSLNRKVRDKRRIDRRPVLLNVPKDTLKTEIFNDVSGALWADFTP